MIRIIIIKWYKLRQFLLRHASIIESKSKIFPQNSHLINYYTNIPSASVYTLGELNNQL